MSVEIGTNGDDSLNGGKGSDTLIGLGGDDELSGGKGDDTLLGGSGDDDLSGGKGDDFLAGGVGDDDLSGGKGDDILLGGSGDDDLDGGKGDDFLSGGAGDDDLSGGKGDDILLGGSGNDNLDGGKGDDLLEGGLGDDVLAGGAGDDLLHGSAGNDTLFGQAGSDLLFGGLGDDVLDGGAGSDFVSGGHGDDEAVFVLASGGSGDCYTGGSGIDTLTLSLTGAEWADQGLKDEVAAYLQFVAAHTDPITGEADHSVFAFSFGLQASEFENLRLLVDGVETDPSGGGDGVVANPDDAVIGEDDGNVVFGSVLDNDVITGIVASVTLVGQPALGILTFNPDGTFAYDPDGAFDSLAVGDEATVTFDYVVETTDGATDQATATITIIGANDGPEFGIGAPPAPIFEDGAAVAINLLIGASDPDGGETATLSVQTVVGLVPGLTIVGNLITVDPTHAAFQSLAAGETREINISYDVVDVHGASVAASTIITVLGTNDVPVVTTAPGEDAGAVIEAANNYGGEFELDPGVPVAAGTLSATDADTGADLTWTGDATGTYGGFAIDPDTGAWTYTLDNLDNDTMQLAQGQTVTDAFTATVTDEFGAAATQEVTVTITGTNDDPAVSSETKATTEDGAAVTFDLSTRGLDADNDDTGATLTYELAAPHFVNGQFGVPTDGVVSVTGTTLTFDPQDGFQDLAEGEQITIVIPVKATDSHGATAQNNMYVTVTGANDAPVITSGAVDLEIVEPMAPADVSASGQITFDDVDLTDDQEVSAGVPTVVLRDSDGNIIPEDDPSGPNLGGLSPADIAAAQSALVINPDGSWTLDIPAVAGLDRLSKDFTLTLETEVVVTDDSGAANAASAPQTFRIVLLGTNDEPEITSAELSGTVTELPDGDPGEGSAELSTSGTIAFHDLDTGDVHSVSVTPGGGGYLGTFSAPLDAGILVGGSTGGTIDWTFAVDDADLDGLAAGQQLIQTYDVTLDDGNGGLVTETVTITIEGANDGPSAATITQFANGNFNWDIFGPAFFSPISSFNVETVGAPGATGFTLQNLTNSNLTIEFTGSGLTYGPGAAGADTPQSGTIETLTFRDGANVVAVVGGLSEDVAGFLAAIELIPTDDSAFNAIMDGYQITYDSSAVTGFASANLFANDDTFIGGEGNDAFRGGDGVDTYDGGPGGDDALAYGLETGGAGIVVDLALGAGTDTYGNAETFTGMNKIWGSQYDDTMYGDAGNNLFEGRAGDDYMDGRGDNDTAWYRSEANFGGIGGVNVNLTTGVGLDSFGNTDTLVDIESVAGTDFADVLVGNGADNDFQGFAGNDSFDGMGGSNAVSFQEESGGTGAMVDLAAGVGTDTYGDSDTYANINRLHGSQYDDTFTGSGANELFEGRQGNDVIDGAGGFDDLYYRSEVRFGGVGGVSVDLGAGTATDSFGDTDTISNIENVIGTDSDDVLIGNGASNYFQGNGGTDFFDGAGGDDTVSFREEGGGNGVVVDLGAGTAIDTFGNAETILNIERVEGSANDDVFTGSGANNSFAGFEGADTYDGGSGNGDAVDYQRETGGLGVVANLATGIGTDTWGSTETYLGGIEKIWASQDDDTLTGDGGDNLFQGNAGDDAIDGGGGFDIAWYKDEVRHGGTGGIIANLAAGTIVDSFGSIDSVTGIEIVAGTDQADVFVGDGADNTFIGFGGADSYDGGAGNDAIEFDQEDGLLGVVVDLGAGTAMDTYGNVETVVSIESVRGSNNDDSITGNGDNNTFRGMNGADFYDGAGGNDRVTYQSESGGAGVVANLTTGTGTDTWGNVETYVDIERLRGSANDDDLTGDANDNRLEGRQGDDDLYGLSGNDDLRGEDGNDSLFGGDGDDELSGGAGNDELFGGAGRDVLNGGDGDDIIDASGGDALSQSFGDIVVAGTGADTIIGHAAAYSADGGLDIVYQDVVGSGGLTITVGANGSGTAVSASPGVVNDTFTYADHFEGTNDDDQFFGSDHDFEGWVGEGGDDFISGGDGFDMLVYRWEDGGGGVYIDMAAGTATDTFGDTDTFTGIEGAQGTLEADTIIGDGGDNRLRGEDGNDSLLGGDGNDNLFGGDGDDDIVGGLGDDYMEGGDGADTFVLSLGDGYDTIGDFDFFEGDRIDLSSYGFTETADFFAPATYDGFATTLYLSATDEIRLDDIDVGDLGFDPEDAFIF